MRKERCLLPAMKTYEEILNSMKATFFEKTQQPVEDYSDLGARFQAVASELFSLACRGDYILKQAFPQTATGTHLEFHAALRDMTRKAASKATGTLYFSVGTPQEQDVVIPQGTICAHKTQPFIQFVTTHSGTIAAGESGVEIEAEAISNGADSNVPAETVQVMINPPAGVTHVCNSEAFSGGCEAESDTMLRKRILDAYRLPPSAVSVQSLREIILKDKAVRDCFVSLEEEQLNVYVKGYRAPLSEALRERLQEALSLINTMGYTVNIESVQYREVTLLVSVQAAAAEQARLMPLIQQVLRDDMQFAPLGENITMAQLENSVAALEGAVACSITCEEAAGGVLSGSGNESFVLRAAEVSFYE